MKRRTFVRRSVAALAVPLASRDPLAGFYRVLAQDPGDVDAVRGDGTAVTLRGTAIKALSRSLEGPVLLARSQGYETARMVLNPSIDRHPALIVQPAGNADVQRAVSFAAEHGLLTAIKCGGHSFSGQSTCDKGVMIDLSRFRAVELDPAARRVVVTGGSLLGPVDQAAQAHELVTPMGTVSHTGVGGLTTGGGFGRVARRFGLSLDNVTAVDVVTADGRLLHANDQENADLFWGVRGGGGNFGIVTSFEFKLHPMQRQVLGGGLDFPIARAAELLQAYNEIGMAAPDDLYLDFHMMYPPGGGEGTAGFALCYSGPASGADQAIAPLRKLGPPLRDTIAPMEYVALQRSGDITDPRAMGMYVKSGFTSELSAEMIDAVVHGFEADPARATQFFTQHAGGAIGRTPTTATAFAHRYARFNVLAAVAWRFGDDPAPHMAWARKYWTGIEKYTRGFYTNEVADESTKVINENYGPNYPRLVELKRKYDPKNLFRLNANVRP